MIKTIKKFNMINENDYIIVGVSGGADSMALLSILLEYQMFINFNLKVVHINHNVREDSLCDQIYVENYCKKKNLPFKSYSCSLEDLKKQWKVSEEEAGRMFRYNSFMQEFLPNTNNKIAVAHNMNDQGETLLLKLFRGSGLKGIGAMEPITNNIIRPLLYTTKNEIYQYLKNNNIEYREDYTNKLEIYSRNKIRLNLIPAIEKDFNPNIVNTLSNEADIFREENKYLDKVAKEKFNRISIANINSININIDLLKKEDIVIKRRILRLAFEILNKNLKDFHLTHINKILILLDGDNSGKKLNLPQKTLVYVNFDELIFEKIINKKENILYKYKLELNKTVYIPEGKIYISISERKIINADKINVYTKKFSYDIINSDVYCRNRQPKDKIYIENIGHKTLKKYFIEKKINKKIRDEIPLICTNDDVIWIIGYLSNKNYLGDDIFLQIWED
ncbi:MAG: tRNA lysidine(34) synthetase TilS [Lachnospirales bacterium]